MKDAKEPVESLCIEKNAPAASYADNGMKFQCDLIEEMGLGSIVDSETITISIYGLSPDETFFCLEQILVYLHFIFLFFFYRTTGY